MKMYCSFIKKTFIITLILLGTDFLISEIHAQDNEKVIKHAFTIKPQLKFSDIKVGGKVQKSDQNFTAESDWYKDISFKLENISGKRIVFINVFLNFPETRATGGLMSYSFSFGHRPGLPQRGNNLPLLLKPGETVEVMTEKDKDRIYKFLNERFSAELIKEIELEIGFVIFDDKTAWSAGSFFRQNADDPRRYDPIEMPQ